MKVTQSIFFVTLVEIKRSPLFGALPLCAHIHRQQAPVLCVVVLRMEPNFKNQVYSWLLNFLTRPLLICWHIVATHSGRLLLLCLLRPVPTFLALSLCCDANQLLPNVPAWLTSCSPIRGFSLMTLVVILSSLDCCLLLLSLLFPFEGAHLVQDP